MRLIDLPYPPNVHNAPANAIELALLLRDAPCVQFNGRCPAEGVRCKMCGRNPPSGQLFEVVLDPSVDERVRIGIGRCHAHHLGTAVRRLLKLSRMCIHNGTTGFGLRALTSHLSAR